jgi:hypothetical protein
MQFRKPKTLFAKHKKEERKLTLKQGKQKKATSGCSHAFGYLANRPKDASVPQECFFCLELLDCSVNTKK